MGVSELSPLDDITGEGVPNQDEDTLTDEVELREPETDPEKDAPTVLEPSGDPVRV